MFAPYWALWVTFSGNLDIDFLLQWGQVFKWAWYSVTLILISGISKTWRVLTSSTLTSFKLAAQWGQISLGSSTTKSGLSTFSRVEPLWPICPPDALLLFFLNDLFLSFFYQIYQKMVENCY